MRLVWFLGGIAALCLGVGLLFAQQWTGGVGFTAVGVACIYRMEEGRKAA